MYKSCGIELGSLSIILSTDGNELYCLCRQPDDLQRLMIGCDFCEVPRCRRDVAEMRPRCGTAPSSYGTFLIRQVWYHIHCIGVSPTKARAMENGNLEFKCTACCERQARHHHLHNVMTRPHPFIG